MAYTTVDRTAYNALIDDSGSGTDGSVWDKADVNDILNAIDALFSSATGLKCGGPLLERNRTANVGEWTSVAYNAANFTASAGTWTVGATDQLTFKYMLVGKTLFVTFAFDATSTSAGMGTNLRIPIPGGFVSANTQDNLNVRGIDAGAAVTAFAEVQAGGTTISFYRQDQANWASGAVDTTYIRGSIFFEVQ